ncbi:MAG: PAS domain S-box protein, partial [Anaerolineales bacterium]|nr:PAS domain S-box protein [Anaerolineales bacterium]
PRYSRGLLLVTFVELPPSEIADKQLELESSDDFQAQRVAELEHELKATGDYLQTVIEELETTNEELKASNEELQSANEELQSTNEELQTSKEELQSTNEELITVNTELQARVEDLTIANNDIKNLMESTRVGIIFLDENLRIRRFTDASRDMIDLIPEDVGRPLKNFVHKLPNLDLMPLVRLVVAQQQTVTREVQGENNLWYLLRIMPYLTVDEQVKGVVLTLTDVTELKQSEGRLQAAVAISGVGVYQHNVPIGPELYHSERWAEMLGYSKSELPAYGEFMDWLVTLLHPDDIAKLDKAYSDFIEGRTEQYEVEVRMQHKLGHWVYVQGLSQALARDAKGWVTEVIGVTLDVTAFRQVEAALRQLSQQRYRELFTNSIVSILLTDSAGEILHANPAACELFGYSEAELLSGRRELIINPDDSRFPKLLADRNRNGRTQGEMSFVRKDGTKFEAEIASALFTTPNGELQASVFIQDITERKQAEETLRFQARLLDAVQQAVIATNNNAEVVYWNPFAEKLYGWSAEEAIGKTTMELISIEDSASLNQEILKSVLEGESWSGEYVARNRAEQQLPIHTTLSPLYSENNELSGIIGISADITDRKQAEEALRESEQRLRELITNSMVGIILARDNGEILFANPAACHMLGYTEAELRAGGRGLIVDPRDKHIVELLSQRERDGRARGEVVLLKRDGTAVDVDLVSVLFTTLDGDKQASVFFQNITERKHAEAELLQARKLESLGVLAGGIAHDFNNLMTALLAHVELAAFSLTPDHPAYEHLVKAGLAREKATNLARQLLTFAKGGAPLKEINDISQLIAEATAFSMHGSSSKLNMIVAPNLWLAEVDRGQITQVLSNLIINARQAMPEGGTITVRATNEEIDAQHWVQIAVQDEGSGITPEHLERIFDPYFSTKADHSGLGLATAHSIITKHQGHITATSQVAEGATFTILLPADPQATLANVEPLPVRERVTSSKPARILGMDDELGIREALEVALGELGYQVSVCEDGESAVAAYRAALEAGRPYDAVILDLTIPGGVSGEAAAQEILKLDPKAKLIVSSGYANAPVMANFMDYGFSARMQKPYDLNTLEYTLSEVLAASGE